MSLKRFNTAGWSYEDSQPIGTLWSDEDSQPIGTLQSERV